MSAWPAIKWRIPQPVAKGGKAMGYDCHTAVPSGDVSGGSFHSRRSGVNLLQPPVTLQKLTLHLTLAR